MSVMGNLTARLSRSVPAQSLAVFRILFGALLIWDYWRFIRDDRVRRYWGAPDFHFSCPGFGWVTPWPEPWLHVAWLGVGLAALMLGLFCRAAIVALTLLFGYFFLLDAAEYLNHFYLVILCAALLCVLPAAQVWSLDALIRRRQDLTVPRAAIAVLRVRTEIMLGLCRAGETDAGRAARRTSGPVAARPDRRHVDRAVVPAGLADRAGLLGADRAACTGAPLLLHRKTRLPVFLIYCAFHAANAFFFNIGIFP